MIDQDRALAPLNAASAAIDKLESYRTPQELAESLQAIGQAVERSLRQLLRADTTAPDEMRLAALSSDDLPTDRLIPTLRKHNIISIQLAGMLHEMMQATTRASNNEVRASDADNARATARKLREEIQSRAAASSAVPPTSHTKTNDVKAAARADAPVREAATNAVRRGDVAEQPHAVKTGSKAVGSRAVLPVVLLVVLALIIWGVMHFAMGSASAMKAGITAFEQQRWGVAEKNFRSVIDAHPQDVTAHLYLGRVLRAEGRAKEAAVVLNEARKIDDNDADVMRELGGTFMDMKQPAPAVTAFKLAKEINPKDPANWIGLVLALRAAGDPAAEQVFAQAPPDAQAKLRGQ
jgi:tetratricopeptide (TPR) repeat protein